MSADVESLLSPDGRHSIAFEPTGEKCMGEPLFRLKLDGALIESTKGGIEWLFGRHVAWSSDSRYLAVQRWDLPKVGPQTSVLLFDLDEQLWRIVGPSYRAVAKPIRFDGAELDFETQDVRTGVTVRGRIDCASGLSRWGELRDLMLP